MILKNVTFTGADDNTNINDLYTISEQHPLVEWGILWYPNKMGTPRYPTKTWIKSFLDNKSDNVNVSLHICGIDAENFGYNINESEVWKYLYGVNRIQLNFPDHKWDLDRTITFLKRTNKHDFRYAVNQFHAINPGRYVIIQANSNNKILNACLENEPNIEFLFDSSRGKGKQISEYPSPIPNKYNGYAGGISPENVIDILYNIGEVVSENDEIWIDMETHIRTNEIFDIDKIKSILDTLSENYLNLQIQKILTNFKSHNK